jgi:hypothetical protein
MTTGIQAAAARKRAQGLAKSDTDAALAVARGIEDPLYRVQALLWIAHFASIGRFRRICDEARSIPWPGTDPYKSVVGAASLIRTLIDHDDPEAAEQELALMLERAQGIDHPVSRLAAVDMLFQAAFHLAPARQRALRHLIEAALSARSWKSGDRLREAAIMLAHAGHRDEADQVIAAMSEGNHRRQAIARIAKGQCREPRPFFW